MIGEARRKIHETGDAIAARQGSAQAASIRAGSSKASDSVMRIERWVRLWLAASSAMSAIVPLTSPSSQERAVAMARINAVAFLGFHSAALARSVNWA